MVASMQTKDNIYDSKNKTKNKTKYMISIKIIKISFKICLKYRKFGGKNQQTGAKKLFLSSAFCRKMHMYYCQL